jgi:hypothetical protein
MHLSVSIIAVSHQQVSSRKRIIVIQKSTAKEGKRSRGFAERDHLARSRWLSMRMSTQHLTMGRYTEHFDRCLERVKVNPAFLYLCES